MQGDMEEREETGNEQMIEEYIGEEDTSHEQSFRMDLPGSEEESYSDQDSDEIDQTCNLGDSLRNWALTFGVSLVALTALLGLLRLHHPDLPKDARTLLKTRINSRAILLRPTSTTTPSRAILLFSASTTHPSSAILTFCPPPPRSPSRPPSLSIPPRQLFQSPYNGSSQNNYTDLSLRHPPPGMSSDGLATSYRERATEVFMPSLNMGRSGKDPIICTAADLHMLTLMETMKQQINQLSMNMSVIMARMAAPEPVVEMPEEISLPLASLEEEQ
ncbi:unnamed protein product [Leuciscus chuanchicus]